MNNLFRSILGSLFRQNSNNDDDDNNEPRPVSQSAQSFDEDEMQRALAESKREFEERKKEQNQQKSLKEMEDMEALMYDEIQSVVFNNEKLEEILKKLPGVNPDDRIFNEFYFNDTNY